MWANRTAVNQLVAKAFESAAFHTAWKQTVLKCVDEPYIADAVATRVIGAAWIIKHKVEIDSWGKIMIEERFIKFVEAVDKKRTKAEDTIPTTNGLGEIPELAT